MFDADKLILEVQKRPCIWNTSCAEYTKKDFKEQAWVEICTIMSSGCTTGNTKSQVKQIKKRWNNIRDSYRKFLNYLKEKEFKGDGPKIKKYVHADILEFLLPSFESKFTTDCFKQAIKKDETSLDLEDEELCTTNTSSSIWTTTIQKIKQDGGGVVKVLEPRRQQTDSQENSSLFSIQKINENNGNKSFTDNTVEILDSRQGLHSLQNDFEENGDKLFLLSFLPDMRNLTEFQKMQFKRGMLDLMQNIKFPTSDSPFA